MKKLFQKIKRRFRCWNGWRKGCMNGPIHKFLVLIGVRKDSTFDMFLKICTNDFAKKIADAAKAAAQGFKVMCEAISEFSRIVTESLSDTFEKLKDLYIVVDKRTMSPREYGRRRITKKGKDRTQYGAYRYIPTFQRNLPYQRRSY